MADVAVFPVIPRATAFDSPVVVEYRGERTTFANPAALADHVRAQDRRRELKAQAQAAADRARDFDAAPGLARLPYLACDLVFGRYAAAFAGALAVVAAALWLLALIPAPVNPG